MTDNPWYKLFNDVSSAPTSAPRGLKTRERLSYHLEFPRPQEQRWCNFKSRKLNVGYACYEFLWYLRGDNADTSITERATIWRELAAQGVLQSNYGQYIFEEGQLERVMNELANDPDSRRASIMILRPDHFHTKSADIPCTLGMTFQIRNMKLHMHVHMRSSDIVFGMGNDVPCFTWTQELLCNLLKRKWPTLQMGSYYHTSDSMHVYARHFKMVDTVVKYSESEFDIEIYEPKISGSKEAEWVINNPAIVSFDYDLIPSGYKWARWMNKMANEVEKEK